MKKTLFRGFKPVFVFTAKQNLKTKGFLATTIIVALIMFVIPFAANVFMGVSAKDDDSVTEEIPGENIEAENYLDKIYFINNTEMADELVGAAIEGYSSETGKKIQVEFAHNEEETSVLKNAANILESNAAIYMLSEKDKNLHIQIYVLENQEDIQGQADELGSYLTNGIKTMSYAMAGIDMDTIVNIQAPHNYHVMQAGEEPDEIGVVLVRMLLPMIVGLVLYMLINMSAQSVTKIVIAEKTSKLMETLLTSAMPYGIIAGKILAVTIMAIGQMLFWLLSLVIGFITGNMVAEAICPGYDNLMISVIDMIKESAGSAFSVTSVVLGLLMLMLGFLFYCVYAGLVGTFVQKAEDLGNSQVFLVIPLMVSWLLAYLAPAIENEALLKFVRIFPLTSPFSMPADVIVGNADIVVACISFVLLVLVTASLVLLTGYMYKKRVFR